MQLKQFNIDNMIDNIKQLRISIDGLAQLTNGLKPIERWDDTNKVIGSFNPTYRINSEPIQESVKCLYKAKNWLGKCLAELFTESPYKVVTEVINIPPTADTFMTKVKSDTFCLKCGGYTIITCGSDNCEANNQYYKYTHLQKVDWIRNEIERVREDFTTIWFDKFSDLKGFFYQIIYQYLVEAKMALGDELARIRDGNA